MKRLLMPLTLPPRFKLPPHRVAHTRHYMPWEKKGPADRTLVFDTFVCVSRHDPLFVGWPDAELSPDDRSALARLLASLTSLGRAEGWVHAELFDGTSEWNCVPTASDPNPVPVFCPDPDTVFSSEHYPTHDPKKLAKGKINPADFLFDCPCWHLCLDTETIHAARWPTAPGARWVNYTRPPETGSVPTRTKTSGRPNPIVARFLLDGPVLPLTTDTVRVAEAFRRAAMSRFETWCRKHPEETNAFRRTDAPERFASEVLSGKDTAGRALLGHGHAHYLPTAEGTDPQRVTHVTAFAADGFGPGEVAALGGLRSLRYSESESLRAQLVGLGVPADFRHSLFGPAKVWESVTPFVGPSHIGRRARRRYLRKALRREIRRAASPMLLPTDVAANVRVEAIIPRPGSPRPLDFRRNRQRGGDDGYQRPCDSFRLTFTAPVVGPICLGYASHYGLGLFTAVDEGGGPLAP
jgi:CRISPR-associated protein Csb2